MTEKKTSKLDRILISIGLVLTICTNAMGATGPSGFNTESKVLDLVKAELSRKLGGARIEITAPVNWVRGQSPKTVESVSLLSETNRGEVQLVARGKTETGDTAVAEGWTAFAAWIPVPLALRRIHPGDRLSRDMFSIQEVNVASGTAREYRGVIMSKDTDPSGLEATQTILEGQFPLVSGVRRVPEVKRGDVVQVRLSSGEISLTTSATAEEPAYLDHSIRVMTQKSKRILVGKLRPGKIVEVSL